MRGGKIAQLAQIAGKGHHPVAILAISLIEKADLDLEIIDAGIVRVTRFGHFWHHIHRASFAKVCPSVCKCRASASDQVRTTDVIIALSISSSSPKVMNSAFNASRMRSASALRVAG